MKNSDKQYYIYFLLLFTFVTCIFFAISDYSTALNPDIKSLQSLVKKLEPLHKKQDEPEPGEWLYEHEESGQTFLEYTKCSPNVPTEIRNKIYIQPIGYFNDKQKSILNKTVKFMKIYFQLPVIVNNVIPERDIPESARRIHPTWGDNQILSTWILDKLLKPIVKDDAIVLLGLTPEDLYPDESWNFVFGQASLYERVGVWSTYRNGDPYASEEEYTTCLLRALETATHETGHMFSMNHCILYNCNMAGSNSTEESDEQNIALRPECLAKAIWAIKFDPVKRFKELIAYCEKNKLIEEAEFYRILLKGIEK